MLLRHAHIATIHADHYGVLVRCKSLPAPGSPKCRLDSARSLIVQIQQTKERPEKPKRDIVPGDESYNLCVSSESPPARRTAEVLV